MADDMGSPRGDGMSSKQRARSGGPPRESAIAYNDGRHAGYIEGATSMIKAAAQEAESMQRGAGKLVIGRLIPRLERLMPTAREEYPPLRVLAEGKFDD